MNTTNKVLSIEEISKEMIKMLSNIPWKTQIELYPVDEVLLIIVNVIIPDELALMAKITNQEPTECRNMRINMHNNIYCKDIDFYSDIY